jgi:high-affinity nickel permease
MYPLESLFGLGDTATEVRLLGVASTQAHGLSIWTILVFRRFSPQAYP